MLSRKLSVLDATATALPVALSAVLSIALVLLPVTAPAASASGGRVTLGDVAASPAAAASVLVAPRFRAGDTLTLHVEKNKHVEVQEQPTSRQASGGDIVIKVLSNDAAGTRLECVYGATTQHDDTAAEIRNNPLMQVMLASREGMTVRFATGPGFSNLHVENVDEVLAGYRRTLEQATKAMPPEVGQAVLRLVEPMLANKQAFAAKLVEDLYIYFMVIGRDVPLQGAVTTSSAMESPAGGAPVKISSNLRVERYDRVAGRVQLRYQQNSNPQDVQAMADRLAATAKKEAAARMGQAAGGVEATEKTAPAETTPDGTANRDAAAQISVQDVAVYDVDLGSGWPDDVRRVRTLQMGVQVLVDEMTFKRVK